MQRNCLTFSGYVLRNLHSQIWFFDSKGNFIDSNQCLLGRKLVKVSSVSCKIRTVLVQLLKINIFLVIQQELKTNLQPTIDCPGRVVVDLEALPMNTDHPERDASSSQGTNSFSPRGNLVQPVYLLAPTGRRNPTWRTCRETLYGEYPQLRIKPENVEL